MKRATRLGALVATTWILSASIASAQPGPQPEAGPPGWVRSQTSRAGLEVDFWPSHLSIQFFDTSLDITNLAWSFTPVAQIGVTDHIFLTAELPLYLTHTSASATGTGGTQVKINGESSDTDTSFTAGNPTPGAYYADMINPDIGFFAGGSVSIPVHFEPSANSRAALAAGAARALYDSHRFVADYLPIRPRGGAEVRLIPHLTYRGDIATPFFVPLGGEDVEFIIEQGNEVEYLTDMGLGGGARLQLVFPLTTNDKIQTATELFGVYEAPEKSGAFVRVGFLLALDKQLGFGFDQGKVASLRLSGGYKF